MKKETRNLMIGIILIIIIAFFGISYLQEKAIKDKMTEVKVEIVRKLL